MGKLLVETSVGYPKKGDRIPSQHLRKHVPLPAPSTRKRLDFLKVLFFRGWLCHFNRLFMPVWRGIDRSKILPVTS